MIDIIDCSYTDLVKFMGESLAYRKANPCWNSYLGPSMYEDMDLQMVITMQCPFKCPFCNERKNPIGTTGNDNFKAQLRTLEKALSELKSVSLIITGGEPLLFQDHVRDILDMAQSFKNIKFISINTTGCEELKYSYDERGIVINQSVNPYVNTKMLKYDSDMLYMSYVLPDSDMKLEKLISIMDSSKSNGFIFRYMHDIKKTTYDITLLKEFKNSKYDISINNFWIGDFFFELFGTYKNKRFRITLSDLHEQARIKYEGAVSTAMINNKGVIGKNWTNPE